MPIRKPGRRPISTTLKIVIGMVVLLVVVPFVMSLYAMYEFSDTPCGRLVETAGDAEKMAYLRDWAETATRRKAVLEYLGPQGQRSAEDGSGLLSRIDPDWNYLGIDPQRAVFGVIRLPEDRQDHLNPDTIRSIAIGTDENLLVLKINGSDVFGMEDDKSYRKDDAYAPVTETAGVYCRLTER
ncbi:MAG: hypothetical protein WD767_10280 [Alphaproteobacteria bacterium]